MIILNYQSRQKDITLRILYLFGPATVAISIILCISLLMSLSKLKTDGNSSRYYTFALKCALILKTMEFKFVSTTDSTQNALFLTSKMAFYFCFTYHAQSVLKTDKISISQTLWMVFCAVISGILLILFIVDDATNYSAKEIGVGSVHNFKMTMYAGNEDSQWIQALLITLVLLDLLYTFNLLYFYVIALKRMNLDQHAMNDGAKGVILLIVSSVIYCFVVVILALDLEIKYLLPVIDALSDNICLYLLFKENEEIYHILCGCLCDKCCIKCIYGSKYQVVQTFDTDEESDNL